ncbi:MAG: ribosomal protein S18-alanine N-acetyltransferase [Xanthomonadales bacterium]|jgi:ribosomal-protein-alanine N-acetyltransferase|nr:ribosomal protein S18-alanine N-acetyltransferase [Xanthomonadales bacterium]MDH3923549.1 ribosomal protein S18-alanine N-acetyltransferase [Xanthomonadales bacterium]MDH4001687.1 ribosomal protein S18-alanine N-acetyltransferase [Xanthomonadales bacterium]
MIADPSTLHTLLRRLAPDDLDRIVEIELSAYPYPWTRGIFADCLRVGYDCWGLQAGIELIGYTIQTHAAGENHLLNLCVAPEQQGKGYGSILLDHAIRLARQQDCFCIFLEVRPSNPAGIRLYRRNGFSVVAERPDYYRSDQGRESALVMKLDLE